MNAKIAVEKIGPSRAKQYLDNIFEMQRPVRHYYVERLVNEMKQGKWRLSSDCILLINGKLANGQHRLHAIVCSGSTQEFNVMQTDDHGLYRVLDSGATRSVADVVKGEYANPISVIGRTIVLYDLGLIYTNGSGGRSNEKATRSLVIEFVEQHRQLLHASAAFCTTLYREFRIIVPTIMGAVLFLGWRDTEDPEKVNQFVTHVYNGNSSADAARDLRERLVRSQAGAARLHRHYLLAIAIKSLKSYLNGTRIGSIKIAEGEAFPCIK